MPPVHLFRLVADDLHGGHGSIPARLKFVLAVCRRSCNHKPGDPRPTAVKAVRGFFQGFPLYVYRKTLGCLGDVPDAEP